jgi:hypothetical protein
MGTNFYTIKHKKHIGKRYAAGLYCWDCDIKMPDGKEKSPYGGYFQVKTCPLCGKSYQNEKGNTTAFRELGFNKSKPTRKTGVATCCGFIWAMSLENLCGIIGESEDKTIIDEYSNELTLDDFNDILSECPLNCQQDNIGKEFC